MTRLFLLLSLSVLLASCSLSSSAVRYSPMEMEKFSQEHQNYIRNKQVALGMTQQGIRFSWGSPSSLEIAEDANGNIKEKWLYKSFGSGVTTLIFSDSVLTGIVSGPSENPFKFSRKDRSKQPEPQTNSNPKIIQQQ